jgi:hypothetical protein
VEEPTAAPVEESAGPSDLALYVSSVVDPAAASVFYTAQAGQHLVSLNVIVDNQSGEAVSINPLNATLVDSQGLLHSAELGAAEDQAQIATMDLYPGERIQGWITFAMEDGSTAAKVKYELDMFSGEHLEAEVGAAVPAFELFSGQIASPHLGETGSAGGYTLMAEEVVDPAPTSSFFSPAAGSRLVSVSALVRNESGSEALSVNPLYFYLVDDYGFVYGAELGSSDLGQIDTMDVASGEAVKGYVSFQVPEGRVPLYLRFATDFWGEGEPLVAGLQE